MFSKLNLNSYYVFPNKLMNFFLSRTCTFAFLSFIDKTKKINFLSSNGKKILCLLKRFMKLWLFRLLSRLRCLCFSHMTQASCILAINQRFYITLQRAENQIWKINKDKNFNQNKLKFIYFFVWKVEILDF